MAFFRRLDINKPKLLPSLSGALCLLSLASLYTPQAQLKSQCYSAHRCSRALSGLLAMHKPFSQVLPASSFHSIN